MKRTQDYKRLYVWEGPVRIFHWLNVLSIVTLTITGFLIADPPAIMSGDEASHRYWFGVVRFIHFTAAYVFVGVMILRIYWAFAGNRHAHWKSFLPFSKEARHNIMHVLKHDILLIPEKNSKLSEVSIGHNKLAALSYAIMFLLALIMVFTGFGLFSNNAGWWFPKMFAWVVPMLGGDFMARTLHHLSMWGIWFIVFVHVYLVLFHDWLEGRGETSSMISGFKFFEKERFEEESTK